MVELGGSQVPVLCEPPVNVPCTLGRIIIVYRQQVECTYICYDGVL